MADNIDKAIAELQAELDTVRLRLAMYEAKHPKQ